MRKLSKQDKDFRKIYLSYLWDEYGLPLFLGSSLTGNVIYWVMRLL